MTFGRDGAAGDPDGAKLAALIARAEAAERELALLSEDPTEHERLQHRADEMRRAVQAGLQRGDELSRRYLAVTAETDELRARLASQAVRPKDARAVYRRHLFASAFAFSFYALMLGTGVVFLVYALIRW